MFAVWSVWPVCCHFGVIVITAFVAPEYKLALIANEFESTKLSEKGDVYSIGVIVFILMTLMTDRLHLANFFLAPKSKNHMAYLVHLKDQITSMTSSANYSKELVNISVQMLHPSPERRPSIKQLIDRLFFEFNQDLPPPKTEKQSIFQLFTSVSEQEELILATPEVPDNDQIVKIRDKTIKIKNRSIEQFAEMHIIRTSKILMEGTLRKIKRKKAVYRYYYLTECNFLYSCLSEHNPSTVTRKIKLIPNAFTITMKGSGFVLANSDVKFFLEPETKATRDLWVKTLKQLSYNPKALPLEVHTSQIDTNSSRLLFTESESEINEEYEKQFETIKAIDNLPLVKHDSISVVNKIGSGSFGSVSIIDMMNVPASSPLSSSPSLLSSSPSRSLFSSSPSRSFISPNRSTSTRLAMKSMSVELEPNEFELFYSDLRRVLTLSHSHLMKLKGISYETNQICFIYDYFSMGSIGSLLTNGAIVFRTRLDVMCKVAQALAYMHSKNVTHENLKPNNILIQQNCSDVSVTDFSFTSLRTKLLGKTSYNIMFQYIPPEKYNRGVSSGILHMEKAGDVYTFGIIMAEWITGSVWSVGKHLATDIMQKVKDGQRPELPSAATMVQQRRLSGQSGEMEAYEQVTKLLQTCWASDPDQRPSFSQITAQLTKVQQTAVCK